MVNFWCCAIHLLRLGEYRFWFEIKSSVPQKMLRKIKRFCCVFFPLFLHRIRFDRPSPVNNDVECAYMKILIEKIVTSDIHSISMMTALHLCAEATQHNAQSTSSSSKKITKQRAEDLLDEWVASGYFFSMNGDASITLGPKTLTEFRESLRTKFPDYIQNCHLCSEITMQVCLLIVIFPLLFACHWSFSFILFFFVLPFSQ